MIALLKEYVLTDNSKVYDIELQEAGVTLVSIPCRDKAYAERLLEQINDCALVKVIR